MSKPKRPPKQSPPRKPRWDDTHASYLTGRAHIDGAAKLGVDAEAHWGCGRLRLLVDPDLREKFDTQRSRLQTAIETAQNLEDVVREADRMANAWRRLDQEARAAGHPPLAVTVWELTLKDGTVAAIVQDTAIAKDVIANGRKLAVYTLDEIGELLSHYAGVISAKLAFPGAEVVQVRKTVSDPLNDFRNDDIEKSHAAEAQAESENEAQEAAQAAAAAEEDEF